MPTERGTLPTGDTAGVRPLEADPDAGHASYFQEHQILRCGGAWYSDNDIAGWRIRGGVDTGLLNETLTRIAQRHETLRTSFRRIDRRVYQVIEQGASMLIQRETLDRRSPRRARDLTRFALRDLEEPFRVSEAPVARATLVRVGPRDHLLLLTVAHLIWDAWSARIFAQELRAVYAALEAGAAPRLPAVHHQFLDFAEWEREPASVCERRHWEAELRGAPRFVPFMLERPRRLEAAVGWEPVPRLLRASSLRIAEVARKCDASVGTVLLTAFAVALRARSRSADFVIGMLHANRDRAAFRDCIGFFASGMLVRFQIDDAIPFTSLVGETKRRIATALDHWLPIEQQVALLAPSDEADYTPVIHDVTFNFIPGPLASFASPQPATPLGRSSILKPVVVPRRRYSKDATWHNAAMVVTVWETSDGGLAGHVEHNGAVPARDATDVGQLLHRALLEVARNPRASAANLMQRLQSRRVPDVAVAGGDASRPWRS